VNAVFVGLDMSLSSTGFSTKSEDGVHVETIKSTPKTAPNDLGRLLYICHAVMDKIPANVGMVCVEDYFTPSNRMQIGAAMKLVALGTAMRLALYHARLPFFIVSPPQLKKFVTGKGNSQKSLIVRDVYRKWGLDVNDDNQADAAVLAYMAEAIWKSISGDDVSQLPKYQQDVLKKVIADRPRYNLP